MICSEGFHTWVKAGQAGAFSRRRKVDITWVTHSILNNRGKTQKMELRNFLKLTRPGIAISTWGYTKARLKINPDAFVYLSNSYLELFYCKENEDFRDYKGYVPVAIDGTDLHLPATEETVRNYGNGNSRSDYPVVMASASCAYDVCNHMILDAKLERYKRSERDSAREHMKKISSTYPQKFIYLFDRGYPAAEFLMELLDNKQSFLFRLDTATFKREQVQLDSDDAWIDIFLDQTRINPYRGTPLAIKMRQVGRLRLRMTQITLPEGGTETLLSNLPEDEFSHDELAELYHMRWGIETMYDTLKNKLQIENFSGKLQRIIEQDFYSTIYLYNLISDIQHDAETAMTLPQQKYGMKANQTMAVGIVKEALIQMATARSGTMRSAIYNRIIAEIQAYMVPIRPNRHFPRNTAPRKTKHSINRKNSY
jgi:hypothetical protein